MDFYEVIIDRENFNSGWHKTNICGWCNKKLNYNDKQYSIKGNMCETCSTRITNIHMQNIEIEKKKRLEDKKAMLETLGSQLDHDLDEEERAEIVRQMETLYSQIKYVEVSAEL